jgi:acyl-CoA thioester hydrolase
MPRDDFRLRHELRVRWSEVDPQGIVFNPNYLTYFDVAATEYWRALGYVYPEGFHGLGVDTFAVSAKIDFKAPARYDDLLDVLARTARIGRTSLRMLCEVHRGAELLVSGELTYVLASVDERRPTPIPEGLMRAILDYERTSPDRA